LSDQCAQYDEVLGLLVNKQILHENAEILIQQIDSDDLILYHVTVFHS